MKKEKTAKADKNTSAYSATEVGTMLESIHKEVRIVAENHSSLDHRLEKLEIEVHGNSRRLDMMDLTIKVTKDKVSHLEDAVSKISKDLRETREELKAEIVETKTELKAEFKSELAATKAELKNDIRELGNRLSTVESGN